MKAGLFIPCYVDQLYPKVGMAAIELLEKLGVDVEYPRQQTCCGQPMANGGFEDLTFGSSEHFYKTFNKYDYVISPSGSCIAHVKHHLTGPEWSRGAFTEKAYELCEFLYDVLKVDFLPGNFDEKVGIHRSCHGLRELRLGPSSELKNGPVDKVAYLLNLLGNIEIVEHPRVDECCGFGGTFALGEEAVSVAMGHDRVKGFLQAGATVITGADMSCLMHLEGIIKKSNYNIEVVHVAEILNSKY